MMQKENFFTYKLYTATEFKIDIDKLLTIDIDKVLGRRLFEVEQNIEWTPEQRTQIFQHIGNAELGSAFKLLSDIIPSSFVLPFSELTRLQDQSNEISMLESTKAPSYLRINSEYDQIILDVSKYVFQWLHYERMPDEKDYNSYRNKVQPFLEEQLNGNGLDRTFDTLIRYLDGVDDQLFAESLVLKARHKRLLGQQRFLDSEVFQNELDGIGKSLQQIVRVLPSQGGFVDDLFKVDGSSIKFAEEIEEMLENDNIDQALILMYEYVRDNNPELLDELQILRSRYTRFNQKRVKEGKEYDPDESHNIKMAIFDILGKIPSISGSSLVDSEVIKEEKESSKQIPSAWIYIKGTTDTKQFTTNELLEPIARYFGRRLASINAGLLIGSWRGINRAVAQSFLQSRQQNGGDINQFFKMMAEGDIEVASSELLESEVQLDFKSIEMSEEAHDFADVCVLIGESGSSSFVGTKFLSVQKPVLPILESGAQSFYKSELRSRKEATLNYIYGVDFNVSNLDTNYKDAIDIIVRYLEQRYDQPQQDA